MQYDEDIQKQARKMHEKVEELKSVIADIVIETHKEYLYIDTDNDRKLSSDAAKVLDIVSDIRDINDRMVDMIEGDAELSSLRSIIEDLPSELIYVEKDKYGQYKIYVDGRTYSDYLNYSKAYNQLKSLVYGYELGQLRHCSDRS